MNRCTGHTLVELMIALAVFSVISAGSTTFFLMSNRVAEAEAINSALQANLRVARERIIDVVRNAGYGFPDSSPASWVPWVTGYAGPPVIITDGAGTAPDELSITSCTPYAVASLTADVTAGATVVPIDMPASADTGSRRTIQINEQEHALVTFVDTDRWTIDTDPVASGTQGLANAYPSGTPVCRLEVKSFRLDTTSRTLQISAHNADGYRVVASEITDIQVQTLIPGERYRIQLTATAARRNPLTNDIPSLTLQTAVSLKN
ncbi:MAG: type II secretion system protein [Granulosicoccus sp.]|nr:type II secretion system protein [Granulosicoccus sp.]